MDTTYVFQSSLCGIQTAANVFWGDVELFNKDTRVKVLRQALSNQETVSREGSRRRPSEAGGGYQIKKFYSRGGSRRRPSEAHAHEKVDFRLSSDFA